MNDWLIALVMLVMTVLAVAGVVWFMFKTPMNRGGKGR